MTEVFLEITGVQAAARKTGLLTAGMVGVPVSFSFSPEWEGLNLLAVFRAGDVKKDYEIVEGKSRIPGEVMMQPGAMLCIGVEGRSKNGDLVIPTVWAEVGRILEGAYAAGDPALAPTPSQYERFMAGLAQVDEKVEAGLQRAKESGEFNGQDGEPGLPGVHFGSDNPPDGCAVWVNPDGEPTSTEEWEFEMEDGSTDTRRVVVVGSGEANGYAAILKVKQDDGTWAEIPAIVGAAGKDGVSPTVSVAPISGGNRVTITDVNGAKSFDVVNGAGGSGGLSITDDGEGNVTIYSNGSVSITDDGNGNVVIA